MNLKKILIGAAAIFSIYAPVANAEVVVVQGSGSTESAAIQDAKRQAVEEVVGVILKSESSMVNFNLVYDAMNVRAQGYVKSFKILNKKKSGEMIDITAQVDISSDQGSELMKDMEVIMSLNDPRLAVVTEYYGDDGGENFKRYAEMCNSAIRQELIKRGFTHVVDKPANVDYIIVGKLTVGKGRAITLPNFNDLSKPQMTQMETGLTKNEAIIDCKIKKADTDEIIGEFHANGSNIGSSSGSLDNQTVLQLAGKAAQEVRTIFNLEASKVFKSVKIVAQSSDSGKLMQLENYLRQVQGVTGVYVRSMSNGKCIIDVSTGLSPQNLHRSLSEVVKNKFPIRLQSFSSTVLEISI